METNEGIIETEARIEQRLEQSESRQNSRDDHRGEHAALVARGGIHSHHPEEDEETPLLARHQSLVAPEDGHEATKPSQKTSEDDEEEWPGQQDIKDTPWWRRPSILWIIGPFLLYTIGFGGTLVPKINLIQDLLCRDYYMDLAYQDPNYSYTPIMFGQDDSRCTAPEIERRAAGFMATGSLISGLLSAITSPKLGELSDYYGRKPVLMGCVSGSLMLEILTVCAAIYTSTFNVYWLWVGWFFEGLAGSFIAGMALTNSYAADTTAPSQRNVAFAYFHGCLFTGIALGPLIASQVIRITKSIAPVFIIALAFHLIFMLCLALFIPESLSKRRQLANRERRKRMKAEDRIMQYGNHATKAVYTLVSLFRPLKVLYPKGPGSSPALRRNLVVLAAVDFTVFGVAMGAMSVVTIYVRKQFHWDTAQQGDFISAVNISRVLMLVVVLPLLVKMFRKKASGKGNKGCDPLDLSLIRAAVVFDTLGYLGYTLARQGGVFVFSGVIASLGGMASPTLQSALTKHVPHDRTGQLLGATGLLHAIGRIVSPLIFNGIFAATNDKFRQTVFACLTAAFGVALILTFMLRQGVYLDETDAADAMDGANDEHAADDASAPADRH